MHIAIQDEFSPLKKVAVAWGHAVPEADEYTADDPEEQKWGWSSWDKQLLLDQQSLFFERMSAYDIELTFLETDQAMPWQMYTRDTAFVIGEEVFFAAERTLQARQGEIEKLWSSVSVDEEHRYPLDGRIEGGDVLVGDTIYVGESNRTDSQAIQQLSTIVAKEVKSLYLGDAVMHLDTRLTLLPKNYALACMESFTIDDREYLENTFKLIPVSLDEAQALGTNVFCLNPETICVEARQTRLQEALKAAGFKVESIPYSEPIALGGSFRCTTLPLERSI